ncbi:MAG: DUF951 domain-containing protein [Sulfobacillus thermosulfidooxidans]|uniref:DUF951 domain-containing protein n=1 Tax=Sulfobacillus thermosulfidooxidans TaxID=28034 RepID=A0A2T2X0E3_SULTH|nr:MAG: DUF951 domain-containing protein [Sulfobacillus thermosulfidooxidans]
MGPIQYHLNDIVELKKPHPCGNKLWIITRTGIDFGLKCQKCGHRIMIPRKTFERAVKRIVSVAENVADPNH